MECYMLGVVYVILLAYFGWGIYNLRYRKQIVVQHRDRVAQLYRFSRLFYPFYWWSRSSFFEAQMIVVIGIWLCLVVVVLILLFPDLLKCIKGIQYTLQIGG